MQGGKTVEIETVTNKRIHKFGEFELMKALAVLGLPIVHLLSWVFYGMDLFGCEEGVLTLLWFIVASVLITGICVYVAVRHGMKVTKLLARMTSFRRRSKKKTARRQITES